MNFVVVDKFVLWFWFVLCVIICRLFGFGIIVMVIEVSRNSNMCGIDVFWGCRENGNDYVIVCGSRMLYFCYMSVCGWCIMYR